MARYEICRGKSATPVSLASKRNPQTVMEWVHRYNEVDLQSLEYWRSGGCSPFVGKNTS